MFANVTERFGCTDCKYFTNSKSHIKQHLKSKKHTEKMIPRVLDEKCKFQCSICLKKQKSQSSLWYHKQICKPVLEEVQDIVPNIDMQTEISEMKCMIKELIKNQQPTTNVTNNNITNNINIFLNDKCGNAVNMLDFVKGIKFCAENFELENLLFATALDHTASIFEKHLNTMTLNERPMHSFTGEDPHQLIAHYRHNNEWKIQTEMKMLDESHRDFDGNDPVDTFMFYLAMFHTRRRDCFERIYGKRHRLSPNLNHTTNSSEQYDLSRRLLEMVAINPTEKELKE
jgi:hypothetical protein